MNGAFAHATCESIRGNLEDAGCTRGHLRCLSGEVIPSCPENGNTPPCVPALNDAPVCPDVANTIAGDYATEVLKSCGITSAAREMVAVQVARATSLEAASAKFHEIVCDASAAPLPDPEACAANLAKMGCTGGRGPAPSGVVGK